MRPEDETEPAAARVQAEILRRMTPAQRVALCDGMSRDVRALAFAGLRQQYPDATEREILDAFTRRTLPAALAEAVIHERDRRNAAR